MPGWDDRAEQWLAWARTPGFDSYWYYRDTFFERILPPPGRATLEVGCGEGRVARDLSLRGHRTVAVDASQTLVRHARGSAGEAGGAAPSYAVADAASLPFPDRAFDLVVAYNSLMDVDDMPGAVREAARVLEPGARFAVCVTHPVSDAGRFASTEPDAPFVIKGSYLGSRRFEEVFERGGLKMNFGGWIYDLETYFNAFEAAGFLVERLLEPPAPAGRDQRRSRIPNFLMLRCVLTVSA